jgi:hypothetical protein
MSAQYRPATLEIQISRTSNGFVSFQSHYVEKILEKSYKGENNIIKTLIYISIHLSKNRGNGINQL